MPQGDTWVLCATTLITSKIPSQVSNNLKTCCEFKNLTKQLRSACVCLEAQDKWTNLLNIHVVGQKAHREYYYGNRYFSETYPEKMLYIIHDKMDHSKMASPHFSHKTNVTESFMKMSVAVTGIIAHGHGNVRYAHYGVGIFPTDSNHTIGSIARLLHDLEGAPKNSLRTLFSIERNQSTLTKVLLVRAQINKRLKETLRSRVSNVTFKIFLAKARKLAWH